MCFDEAAQLWWKFTKSDLSGYTVEWSHLGEPFLTNALPIEYFQRLRLQNSLFGDAIQFNGLWNDPLGGWRIVTTQPHVEGLKATLEELCIAFEKIGFEQLPWQGMGYKKSLAFRKEGYDV